MGTELTEWDKARKNFVRAVENVNRERDKLNDYKKCLAAAVRNLKYCKSKVEKCPLISQFESVVFPTSPFEVTQDLCLNSKAYAYVLYFRKQIKSWEKKIRKQKEVLRQCNLQLSYANTEFEKLKKENHNAVL